MTQLTDRQIAELVVDAGFVGDERVIGVAVVLAESGGKTDNIGDVSLENATFGPSVGLFQIRSLRSEKGTGGVRDELANLDPATNARHAHQVFLDAGRKWTPWSTFKNDLHKPFLARARAAVAAVAELSPPQANRILAAVQQLRHDLIVFGTANLDDTVEGFATRQRQILARLDQLNARLGVLQQHLGIEP